MSLTTMATGRAVAASLLALSLALGACSSGSTPAPSAAAPAAGSAAAGGMAITIKDFSFDPTSLTVPVGSTVTWTNQGAVGHTVTADDGSFDSKTVGAGTTFSHAFAKAGTYAYHCTIHASMKATIVVQ